MLSRSLRPQFGVGWQGFGFGQVVGYAERYGHQIGRGDAVVILISGSHVKNCSAVRQGGETTESSRAGIDVEALRGVAMSTEIIKQPVAIARENQIVTGTVLKACK